MSKYYKAEDVIRKRAEDLADTSYWEYGNPKNVDEWLEVAEMEFKDLPTIDIVHCCECKCCRDELIEEYMPLYIYCEKFGHETEFEGFCKYGERIDNE